MHEIYEELCRGTPVRHAWRIGPWRYVAGAGGCWLVLLIACGRDTCMAQTVPRADVGGIDAGVWSPLKKGCAGRDVRRQSRDVTTEPADAMGAAPPSAQVHGRHADDWRRCLRPGSSVLQGESGGSRVREILSSTSRRN